jgi:hypothetical protein
VQPDGAITLPILCQPGRSYALEQSSDLTNWQTVTLFTATNTTHVLYDSNVLSAASQRYYRARTP